MKADLHVHTYFSCDSRERMERYCDKAIRKGITCLCFTEHVDYNPEDEGFGYYEAEKYFDELGMMQSIYKDKLTLLSGIEFSEPHLYQRELKELAQYPYDFIIGSVHYVNGVFPDREMRKRYTLEDYFKLYWNEVLEAVSCGGFDSLGHMDFPKRCLGEALYSNDIIDEIFKTMLHNNIALEINTSSFRYGFSTTLPGPEHLLRYKELGGSYVTFGSDAHREESLASNIQLAKDMMEDIGLQEVIFQKRKAMPVVAS